MSPSKNITLAAAVTSLLAMTNACAAGASAPSSTLTMKPAQGISFDVEAGRAVSYFLSESGHCKLVLTIAGEPNWDEAGSFAATRFEAAIGAGKATRYNSSKGKTLEFACAADAQAMSVTQVEHVAASAGQ